ncbi:hypothetical protein F8M41_022012 [Gigaspora margarita]|uniref:Uncharacterized protein n=1 Tax=Gigaspora margarita TaxID=4874 RepID=A0A8H4AFT1_GIGMA|nr:hypothetical protein F8M41_022012 [Gigaspora margarita]
MPKRIYKKKAKSSQESPTKQQKIQESALKNAKRPKVHQETPKDQRKVHQQIVERAEESHEKVHQVILKTVKVRKKKNY